MRTIAVIAYPEDPATLASTIASLEELLTRLEGRYQIRVPVSVVSLPNPWSDLFRREIQRTGGKGRALDPVDLADLLTRMRFDPRPKGIRTAANLQGDFGMVFVRIPETMNLKKGPEYSGGTSAKKAVGVAVERMGRRETIYHECLHLLGIESEGYDETSPSHPPKQGCEHCWMRFCAYEGATPEHGLCEIHLSELKTAVINWSSSS